MKKFIVWVRTTVLIFILIAIGIITLYSILGRFSKPDDNQMIDEFKRNKNKYFALIEMIKEDKQLDHLHLNSQEKVSVIPHSRIQDYYALMRDLKLSSIFQHRNSTSIHEVNFTRHFHSCDDIGVIYTTTNPDSIVPSIDLKNREPYKVYYRPIEPNWYLTTSQICD